jgi:hypothetical protein
MARKVVVFARDDDLHADAVIDYCSRYEVGIARIDVGQIIGGNLTVDIEFGHGARGFVLSLGGHSISSSDDLRLLCRDFELPAIPSVEDLAQCIALEEARCVLNGWANAIPRRKWIDHPVIQAEFDNKPIQLAIAEDLGLLVPRTLITNKPKRGDGIC